MAFPLIPSVIAFIGRGLGLSKKETAAAAPPPPPPAAGVPTWAWVGGLGLAFVALLGIVVALTRR